MADQWLFKSETYDNCNCSVSCGCQFNEPTTHGNCRFAYAGTVVAGHFNGTPLAGLNWSLLCIFPGEIEEGNGKRQIIIDERANEAQRIALEGLYRVRHAGHSATIFPFSVPYVRSFSRHFSCRSISR